LIVFRNRYKLNEILVFLNPKALLETTMEFNLMLVLKKAMIFIPVLLFACSHSSLRLKPTEEGLIGVLLTHTVSPSLGPGNADLKRSDTMSAKIYFWKNQVLYESYHMNYYMPDGRNVVKAHREKFILVSFKDSSFGYYYDVFKNMPARKVNLDSFLKYEWFANIKLYPIFSESDHQIVSSKTEKQTNNLIEIYSLKGKGVDTNKTGEISLIYSSRINGSPFSLSRELDSIKKMTLIGVKIVNNSRVVNNIELPKISVENSLEVLTGINDKKLFSYFITSKNIDN